jgi:hypothetical protein
MVRPCRLCGPIQGWFLYTQDDELLRRRKAADRMAVDAATNPAEHPLAGDPQAAITFKDVT